MTPDELRNLVAPAPPCGISGRRTWALPRPSDSLPESAVILFDQCPGTAGLSRMYQAKHPSRTGLFEKRIPSSGVDPWDEIAFGEYDHLTR